MESSDRILIAPVGKPRMTSRDRWGTNKRPAVERYHAFCDELRLKYKGDLPDEVQITFRIPMPKSWSETKKQTHNNLPHQQKPDIDNLCKAVMDALSKSDESVWRLYAAKRWGREGSIEITSL